MATNPPSKKLKSSQDLFDDLDRTIDDDDDNSGATRLTPPSPPLSLDIQSAQPAALNVQYQTQSAMFPLSHYPNPYTLLPLEKIIRSSMIICVYGDYMYKFNYGFESNTVTNTFKMRLPDCTFIKPEENNIHQLTIDKSTILLSTRDGTLLLYNFDIPNSSWTILPLKVTPLSSISFISSQTILVCGGCVTPTSLTTSTFIIRLTTPLTVTRIPDSQLPATYGGTLMKHNGTISYVGGVQVTKPAREIYEFTGTKWIMSGTIEFDCLEVHAVSTGPLQLLFGSHESAFKKDFCEMKFMGKECELSNIHDLSRNFRNNSPPTPHPSTLVASAATLQRRVLMPLQLKTDLDDKQHYTFSSTIFSNIENSLIFSISTNEEDEIFIEAYDMCLKFTRKSYLNDYRDGRTTEPFENCSIGRIFAECMYSHH